MQTVGYCTIRVFFKLQKLLHEIKYATRLAFIFYDNIWKLLHTIVFQIAAIIAPNQIYNSVGIQIFENELPSYHFYTEQIKMKRAIREH